MSDHESGPTLRQQVAATFQTWLPSLFDESVPHERRATCESCAMCVPTQEGAPVSSKGTFNPSTKCCTYYPNLPAFIVGALLSDDSPELAEGQRRIRARIAAQHGVSPRGVEGPPAYWQRYESTALFGRSKDMLCPYYAEGKCTIWKYREPVCATYYCKFDQGEDGRRFWTSLRDYLLELNAALNAHAMLELGFAPEQALAGQAREVTAEEIDGEPLSPAAYQARWKHYAGREEQFFRDAYAVVSKLSPDAAAKAGGVRVRARLMQLTRLREVLREPVIPLRLKRNPRLVVEPAPGGGLLVEAYSGMDPSRVPEKLYGVLDAFDGRPSGEVLAELKTARRPYPSEALLRGLYQHRLLLDAGEQERSENK